MAGATSNRFLNNSPAPKVALIGYPTENKGGTMKELTTFRERMEGKLNKKLRNDKLDAQFSENDHSGQAWMDYIP